MSTLTSNLAKTFRANVTLRLAELGWNRADLADEMGVTPSYVSQVMGGHCGIGLAAVERFAKALGVSASDLLKILSKTG